jgi:hypothetical protein
MPDIEVERRTSPPQMPNSAAPKATKVATSNERTRTTSSAGWLVGNLNRRLDSSA